MTQVDYGAIIFDNDGVIVDSEIIHISVEMELLAELGLHYEYKSYLNRFVGSSNSDFYKMLNDDSTAMTGRELPENFSDILKSRVWPRMTKELKLIAGIEALVDAIDVPFAIASSAPLESIYSKLDMVGLIEVFESNIYSAEQVTKGKPEPDLFLHVARQLNVAPSECIVIEDSILGVTAALAADMTAIGFVGGSHADENLIFRLREAGAIFVVQSHRELLECLN